MKKALFIALACLAISGCLTSTKTFPIVYTHSTSTEFEILGTIFIKSANNVGYNTVFEEAKKQFPLTDFVIDIMIDQHEIKTSYHIIAYLIRQMFGTDMRRENIRYEYTIRGTAIKYIRRNIDGEIIPIPTPSYAKGGTNEILGTITEVLNLNKNETKQTAPTKVEDRYTVVAVNGRVQMQKSIEDAWLDVKVGDFIEKDFRLRTASNSSLVLSDGKNTVTIPGSVEGRVNSLIGLIIR